MSLEHNENIEILLGFLEECQEDLDEAEPLFIECENSTRNDGKPDSDTINTIFRLFHSMKGGAGFLDLTTISSITHDAETLLDLFRKGEGSLKSEHIDLLTNTCDLLREIIHQTVTTYDDSGFEVEVKKMKARLGKAISEIHGTGKSLVEKQGDATEKLSNPVIHDAEPEPEVDSELPANESNNSSASLTELAITPEIVEQFVSEAEQLLDDAEQYLLGLEKNPADRDLVTKAFRSFHSFKGNCGFLGFADLESISHAAESVLDQFREQDSVIHEKLISTLLEFLDFIRTALSQLSAGKTPSIPALPGLKTYLAAVVQECNSTEDTSESDEHSDFKEVADSLDDTMQSEKLKTDLASHEMETKDDVQLLQSGNNSSKNTDDSIETDKQSTLKENNILRQDKKKPLEQPKQHKQYQTIRVDVEKLDRLLDLVGELVIAEVMVSQNPDLKGITHSMDRFDKAVMQLDKITRDLQDIANSIRMIPLSGTFKRMVRLVRDLSHKAGKKVEFEILGEETEVDKTVIEQIADPLVHIIRNSIDHGIEKPEDRLAAGKAEVGKLTLEAEYIGGEVWIRIRDDGKGLKREALIERAREKGLLDNDCSEMSDLQVFQLIFQPGFSTAKEVTDISGRGVGMDVVRKNIESIRGKVDVQSESGKGTEIILRIPLTLAIIDGMIIRVGNLRFTMPLTSIRESLQVRKDIITVTPDGQEILKIRNELIPVVRLHELFEIEPTNTTLESGIITIVENEGRVAGLFVDELLEQQQIVIKGLSSYIGKLECVSGCTILGDGDISLILDIRGIIEQAQVSSRNMAKLATSYEMN
ncbi:chemotaxis protein CheA [bacterium]|nr:chemotaxis protein CheA [bacterium]